MSFWDVMWFSFISFAFVAYLMVMFSIITILFQDPEPSGLAQAVWVVALIFLPFLTSFVYLIARGRGMAERTARNAEAAKRKQETHVRDVAGTATPVDQVAQARSMLDSGVTSRAEHDRFREKALV